MEIKYLEFISWVLERVMWDWVNFPRDMIQNCILFQQCKLTIRLKKSIRNFSWPAKLLLAFEGIFYFVELLNLCYKHGSRQDLFRCADVVVTEFTTVPIDTGPGVA